jgi:hypothetical protein
MASGTSGFLIEASMRHLPQPATCEVVMSRTFQHSMSSPLPSDFSSASLKTHARIAVTLHRHNSPRGSRRRHAFSRRSPLPENEGFPLRASMIASSARCQDQTNGLLGRPSPPCGAQLSHLKLERCEHGAPSRAPLAIPPSDCSPDNQRYELTNRTHAAILFALTAAQIN